MVFKAKFRSRIIFLLAHKQFKQIRFLGGEFMLFISMFEQLGIGIKHIIPDLIFGLRCPGQDPSWFVVITASTLKSNSSILNGLLI